LTSAFVRPQTTVGAKDARRFAVIEEARAWLRTPYHHMARVKGAGADCLTLLAEVYEKAGVIPHVEVPFYPPPQPGDVAIFKFGRCFAHGAIAINWPQVIHAWHHAGVVYADATQGQLARRPVRIFDPFAAIG
jgi:cell wall-associated NlpC family hydrolase